MSPHLTPTHLTCFHFRLVNFKSQCMISHPSAPIPLTTPGMWSPYHLGDMSSSLFPVSTHSAFRVSQTMYEITHAPRSRACPLFSRDFFRLRSHPSCVGSMQVRGWVNHYLDPIRFSFLGRKNMITSVGGYTVFHRIFSIPILDDFSPADRLNIRFCRNFSYSRDTRVGVN